MSDILAVSILELSTGSRRALRKNGIDTLNELMVQRDLGILNANDYSRQIFQELMDVCDKIDDFYRKLNEKIVLNEVKCAPVDLQNDHSFEEGRRRTFEGIKKDLISVVNLEQPTSLRKAILMVFVASANGAFDRKKIKTLIERKYRSTVSTNTDAIRSTLSSLVSHGFLKCVGNEYMRGGAFNKILNDYGVSVVRENVTKTKYMERQDLDVFLEEHIGKEIEFRYKTDRLGSDKRWRRVTVYDQDDKYLIITGSYMSGRRIKYLKERIVEYREVD